jgi:hypothetical protein
MRTHLLTLRLVARAGLLAAVMVCAPGAWSTAGAADKDAGAKAGAEKSATGKGGGKKGKACSSSPECAADQHCTTEDGACNRPPGCGPKDICAEVCWGVCAPKKKAPSP